MFNDKSLIGTDEWNLDATFPRRWHGIGGLHNYSGPSKAKRLSRKRQRKARKANRKNK